MKTAAGTGIAEDVFVCVDPRRAQVEHDLVAVVAGDGDWGV